MEHFNLMVLGGGSAGFAAAIKAAELGFQVAIVEQATIGGTCVNVGCVPSKTLIKAAEVCYHASYSNFKGMAACPPPSEWGMVLKQKDELVAALREAKYVKVLKAHPNIRLVRGAAELTGGRGLRVGEKRYTADKIVIATGSHSCAPYIPGLEEAGFIDSEAALSMPALPGSMIVLGAGSIGLELGQLFGRFGVQVTLLDVAGRIAPAEEPEIGEMLAQYLRQERLTVLTGARIARVDKRGIEYQVHIEVNGRAEVITAERLLVSTGRRANTEGLGLSSAGVELGPKGGISVNQHLQTTNPDIYAAGDCAGDPMFVYVAAYAGGLAAQNALTQRSEVFDLSALPRVTFTDPQIASVGLTEAEASAAGLRFETSVLPLEHVPRAQASRNLKGLFKLVRERDTARLIGAHVLAAEAGETIQEAALAIRFRLTTDDIIATYHPYLTMVEGIKLACLGFSKDVTELSCCAA
ncbi:MAG TPA: mercury(II) reductase [Candidatus Saccharimonadales bacterium]|nr:mercury(II) reductase [Candidatus Saccharimonadales bacterium]